MSTASSTSTRHNKPRASAMYERPKINVHHHHHVHFMKYFLSCIPLKVAIHILSIFDFGLTYLSYLFFSQS